MNDWRYKDESVEKERVKNVFSSVSCRQVTKERVDRRQILLNYHATVSLSVSLLFYLANKRVYKPPKTESETLKLHL